MKKAILIVLLACSVLSVAGCQNWHPFSDADREHEIHEDK